MPRTKRLFVEPDPELPRIKEFLLQRNGGRKCRYIANFVTENKLDYSKFEAMIGDFQKCDEYRELCLKAMKTERR